MFCFWRPLATLRWGLAGLIVVAGVGPAVAQQVDVDRALAERALGRADAPVTIYAYESFSCVHCAAFHAGAYDELKARYIDTGKVRFIFRDYPLNLQARLAAQVARCADPQHFFGLAGLIFRTQETWLPADNPLFQLGRIGRLAGLSTADLEACVDNRDLSAGIEAIKAAGSDEFGVETTPSFVIGGTLHEGRQTIEQLAAAIDPLLPAE